MTITLPEPLTDRLQQEAVRKQISPEQLAVKLIDDGLDVELHGHFDESPQSLSLTATVAAIKARRKNPDLVKRGEHIGDVAYIDYLLTNLPKDTMTFDEWKEFWPQFEDELKQIEPLI